MLPPYKLWRLSGMDGWDGRERFRTPRSRSCSFGLSAIADSSIPFHATRLHLTPSWPSSPPHDHISPISSTHLHPPTYPPPVHCPHLCTLRPLPPKRTNTIGTQVPKKRAPTFLVHSSRPQAHTEPGGFVAEFEMFRREYSNLRFLFFSFPFGVGGEEGSGIRDDLA
jgi:hypothetical protein